MKKKTLYDLTGEWDTLHVVSSWLPYWTQTLPPKQAKDHGQQDTKSAHHLLPRFHKV